MARSINSNGLPLVNDFEGFYAGVYICPAGVLAIVRVHR